MPDERAAQIDGPLEDFETILARIDRRCVSILWTLGFLAASDLLILGKLFVK